MSCWLAGKTHLLLDRDGKFTVEFRPALLASGVEPVPLPLRSPNLNAHAERFIRTIKNECLGRLILFGEETRVRVFSPHGAVRQAARL